MIPSEFTTEIIDKYIKNEELKRLLIAHSRCVARKALEIADKCGMGNRIDRQFVVDASMLHDIGVVECDAPGIHCYGSKPYICHGMAGSEILRAEGLDEKYSRVCERHTGSGLTADEIRERNLPLPEKDLVPQSLEEKLICYADKFFSKSGDPEEEKSEERIFKSMQKHGEGAVGRLRELKQFFEPI